MLCRRESSSICWRAGREVRVLRVCFLSLRRVGTVPEVSYGPSAGFGSHRHRHRLSVEPKLAAKHHVSTPKSVLRNLSTYSVTCGQSVRDRATPLLLYHRPVWFRSAIARKECWQRKRLRGLYCCQVHHFAVSAAVDADADVRTTQRMGGAGRRKLAGAADCWTTNRRPAAGLRRHDGFEPSRLVAPDEL
jgi:hypothetical protein